VSATVTRVAVRKNVTPGTAGSKLPSMVMELAMVISPKVRRMVWPESAAAKVMEASAGE
jgi:hypothetical protein